MVNQINSVEELEHQLASPSIRDEEAMRRLPGDTIVLGAGGKMGPSLAKRVKRATRAAGVARRVIAASRFSDPHVVSDLEHEGVEVIRCDFQSSEQVARLPGCENVLFLSGRKFGSSGRPDLTWLMNTVVPANVALHYRQSRLVAFSTGNVYPFVRPGTGGSLETDELGPVGEYAQSCLGRERVFEYFSHEYGALCLIFRLNYAVDLRYGVLVDIARKVQAGEPVSLAVGWFNTIWQGDANSYALRSLELAASPARVLNVTGPEQISVREVAEFFGRAFGRKPIFQGEDSGQALLSNAAQCHHLLGSPEISLETLLDWVRHWTAVGGVSLNRPTKFEVADGRF